MRNISTVLYKKEESSCRDEGGSIINPLVDVSIDELDYIINQGKAIDKTSQIN